VRYAQEIIWQRSFLFIIPTIGTVKKDLERGILLNIVCEIHIGGVVDNSFIIMILHGNSKTLRIFNLRPFRRSLVSKSRLGRRAPCGHESATLKPPMPPHR
jgi:hypothetical protein